MLTHTGKAVLDAAIKSRARGITKLLPCTNGCGAPIKQRVLPNINPYGLLLHRNWEANSKRNNPNPQVLNTGVRGEGRVTLPMVEAESIKVKDKTSTTTGRTKKT